MSTTRGIVIAVLLGGFISGAVDITYALTVHGFRGIPPERILKYIASGIWGREALEGDTSMAVAGGLLHFAMTTMMAAGFVIASRILPIMLRYPLIVGPLYGLLMFGVMTHIVVPLSNANGGLPQGWLLVGELLSHTLGVGLPIALVTRRFAPIA